MKRKCYQNSQFPSDIHSHSPESASLLLFKCAALVYLIKLSPFEV